MDKRGFNAALNRIKDSYPGKLILIEGIQRAFNRDVPSISRENLLALYQNPAQFMMKKPLADGMWTTQLHEWADNGVEDLLDINPIYLGAKNAYGDTVLMSMVEYAIGKTTEQINFDYLKRLLEHPMVFEYKTGDDGEMSTASVWDIKDITGRTPIDYLGDMAGGTGTCKGCEPIPELATLIAEWASIMKSALPGEDEMGDNASDELNSTENIPDGEPSNDGDGSCFGQGTSGEVPIASDPGSAEYYPETCASYGIVDENPGESDDDEDDLPEDALAMIHDEVGKDPFIRDTGNVERITMPR